MFIHSKKIFLGLCLCLSLQSFACTKATHTTFKEWLKQHPKTQHIVFFAAWCLACKEGLEKAQNESVIVGVFDTHDHAQQIWSQVNRKQSPCFWDADGSIAKGFEVNSLPLEKKL